LPSNPKEELGESKKGGAKKEELGFKITLAFENLGFEIIPAKKEPIKLRKKEPPLILQAPNFGNPRKELGEE